MTLRNKLMEIVNDYTIPVIGIAATSWCLDYTLKEQGSSLAIELSYAKETLVEVIEDIYQIVQLNN